MGTRLHVLLDQGLPRDAAEELHARGVTCTHVSEVGMAAATDTEILSWARDHGAVIVTLDADFHAILAVSGACGPSVVRVRLQGLNGAALARVALEVLKAYAGELAGGCMITVKRRKTTCHALARPE